MEDRYGVPLSSGSKRGGDGERPDLAIKPTPDESLQEHLKRIEAYMRGCALLPHPRHASELRRELAEFMRARLARTVDQWVEQISEAFVIRDAELGSLRSAIHDATERWIRHIENPDDAETYAYIRSHARHGFISHFPPSRFLATQMKMRAIIADHLRAVHAGDPDKRDALLALLQQEFQERILHITDFFVEGREEELREHEASYRRSIDHAPAAIFELDYDDGSILYASLIAEKVLGYTRDELLGMRIWDLLPGSARPRVEKLFEEARHRGHANRDDLNLMNRRGDLVPMFFNAGRIEFGSHRFLQAICIDISERKRLESQLIQSEKMAAIGQLAAGIAHEIRNPLGIIMNALYDLGEIIDAKSADVSEDLQIAKEEMARVQAIIDTLLEFSRESRAELEAVDINELLRRTLQLMNKSLQNNDVRVLTDFGTLPSCMANTNALRQILLNLITNAVQAMPNGGELRLRTATLPDNRVLLEFRDTGIGIPEDHLRDIFNPFFTTKAPGQGTGLGLSVVHSVVKRFRGDIHVHSQVGKGTTFRIELPCQCQGEIAALPVAHG